jgi:tetratricopeptide (TPR) repeat protein
MYYRLLIFFLLAGLTLQTYCQEETAEDFFEDGDFFFAREEYTEAAYLYKQVLRFEPENYNVHFKLGMAYLNIDGQESEGIQHFLKATEGTSFKYRKNYYPEKNAPHHTWFFLGNAYRINNQLDEALEAYNTFSSVKDFEKKYNIGVTEEEIKAVGRAKIIQDAPLDLYKFCFEEPINTSGKEYNAVISANEKVLVWMNSQKFYEAILMSVKQDGKWSKPINITPQLGSDGDMIPTGLSNDGTELLLVKQSEFDSDIYISTYDGTFWNKAESLKGEINSNFTEDHASFSPDGQKIIFSSDRRGTYGSLDIWISSKLDDGTWGESINAGMEINTELDETSAYISPNGKRFIFSSNGHFNMGGLDIFGCDINDDGSYGPAFNLGYPINTTNNNSYFIPLKDGNSGVYSYRDEDGIGGRDIWFIEIVAYEQTIAKALTRLSEEDFSITVLDNETGEKITLEYDSINDKITVRSKTGKEYKVIYSREKDE